MPIKGINIQYTINYSKNKYPEFNFRYLLNNYELRVGLSAFFAFVGRYIMIFCYLLNSNQYFTAKQQNDLSIKTNKSETALSRAIAQP